jgi:hypothetical protein
VGRDEEKTMKRVFPIMFLLLIVLALSSAAVGDGKKGTGMVDLETAKASFEEYCAKCHGLDRPLGKRKNKDGWETTVSRMSGYHKRFGATIPEDIEDAIVAYLVEVAGK